jgi:predicted glycosyltransferase involved in capsule biosynthesis
VTFLRTEDAVRLGGFDEQYAGHGYEDLDFLVRLAWLHDAMPRTHEAIADAPGRAPLLRTGFRAHLARLALPALLSGDLAFHQHHVTKDPDYYAPRPANGARFSGKLAEMVGAPADAIPDVDDLDLDLIRFFRDTCRARGVRVRDYAVLFDERPGHTDRLDSLARRLRFLIGAY